MLCAAIGYLIALPILKLINFWPLVFILGEIFAFLFAIKTTDFLRDSHNKTAKYKSTSIDVLQLGMSNLISNLLLYLDRLLINPILGPAEVSIYYMATFVGKMIGVVFQPISGVTLSYLSVMPNKSGRQIYIMLGVSCFILGSLVLVTSVPLSSIIIDVLYPDSINKVSKYFLIANLGSAFGIMGSLFQPVILRYCPVYWQIVIQVTYLLVYLGTGLIFINIQGLFGFCLAVLFANVIRIIALLLVGYVYILKPKKSF
jgi:O-antigen/teichoic acid export membrane protein